MSDPLKLDPSDWRSIAIGAAIAVGGALVVYLADVATRIDISSTTGIFLSALAAIGLNLLRKFLTNTAKA
jgi:hypothetical protein